MDKDHDKHHEHYQERYHREEHRRREGRQASRLAIFCWGFLAAFLIGSLFVLMDMRFLGGMLTTQNDEIAALDLKLQESKKQAQENELIGMRLAGLLGIENLGELIPYVLAKDIDDETIKRFIKEGNEARARVRDLIKTGKISKEEIKKLLRKAHFAHHEIRDLMQKASLTDGEIAQLKQEIADDAAQLQASRAKNMLSKEEIQNLLQQGILDRAQIAQQNHDMKHMEAQISNLKSKFQGAFEGILTAYPDVMHVGERFAFKQDIFFSNASSQLSVQGREILDQVAAQILKIEGNAPRDIPWFIRVDGHTNHLGIHTEKYPSNWALSCARAIRVIEYLVKRGVPPHRLVAAGFSQYWPLEEGTKAEALSKNRRIELSFSHY